MFLFLHVLLAVAAVVSLHSSALLTVHIVSHSHDDVGWLKTPDQYFYGYNNSIQHTGVQMTLDSVIAALKENPKRKFTIVETAFFAKWWELASSSSKDSVRSLLCAHQLDFTNGGWVMHDEATTLHIDMIDQMTLGHTFLLDTLGVTPEIGWQIDPFGHSSGQVQLFSGDAGMIATFQARIDYQEFSFRQRTARRQFLWVPSPSRAGNAYLFAEVMLHSTYCPPVDFNFDIILDTSAAAKTLDWANKLRALIVSDSRVGVGSHIMMPMGCDFTHMQAHNWYNSIEVLMNLTQTDGGIEVRYSSPAEYTKAKLQEPVEYPQKYDDFFPYADGPHMFWTGYFTSRPAFKRLVRRASSLYTGLRQMTAAFFSKNASGFNSPHLDSLAKALATSQHHDAITGTAKQFVSFSYTADLIASMESGAASVAQMVAIESQKLEICLQSNVSVCPPMEKQGESGSFQLYVWNPLPQNTSVTLAVPLYHYSVVHSASSLVSDITVVPAVTASDYLLQAPHAAPFTLLLQARLLPLVLHPISLSWNTQSAPDTRLPKSQLEVAENDVLRLHFNDHGLLDGVYNKIRGIDARVTQVWCYYDSSLGNDESPQVSGAYIFRPNSSECFNVTQEAALRLVSPPSAGIVVVEQNFSTWVSQRIMLTPGSDWVEIDFTVGPIPTVGKIGKEVVLKFLTEIDNGGILFTDSNGREMIRRKLNGRSFPFMQTEAVAGNYYPITTGAFIKDESVALNVAVDAPVGCASLRKGELELMVHRVTLLDDQRGVGEPLNETQFVHSYMNCGWRSDCGQHFGSRLIVRGAFSFQFAPPSISAQKLREKVASKYFTPVVFHASTSSGTHPATLRGVTQSLPQDIELTTLQLIEVTPQSTRILLRLSHNDMCSSIDECLLKVILVDLRLYFTAWWTEFNTVSLERRTMTANQIFPSPSTLPRLTGNGLQRPSGFINGTVITMYPQEIHTYKVTLSSYATTSK